MRRYNIIPNNFRDIQKLIFRRHLRLRDDPELIHFTIR